MLNIFILEIQVTNSSSMYFCTSHLMMHVVIFGMLFNKTRQYNIQIFDKIIFFKYRTRQIKTIETNKKVT